MNRLRIEFLIAGTEKAEAIVQGTLELLVNQQVTFLICANGQRLAVAYLHESPRGTTQFNKLMNTLTELADALGHSIHPHMWMVDEKHISMSGQ
ncbi:MAG: hypothetical protein JWM56_1320 [Candidatus Peribacteria bacterium]|nr:hypothetical protein [Candidatus Peribacteria bacterium]